MVTWSLSQASLGEMQRYALNRMPIHHRVHTESCTHAITHNHNWTVPRNLCYCCNSNSNNSSSWFQSVVAFSFKRHYTQDPPLAYWHVIFHMVQTKIPKYETDHRTHNYSYFPCMKPFGNRWKALFNYDLIYHQRLSSPSKQMFPAKKYFYIYFFTPDVLECLKINCAPVDRMTYFINI